MRDRWRWQALWLALALPLLAAGAEPEGRHGVRIETRVLDPRGRLPGVVRELFQAHPEMAVKPFSGIAIADQGKGPGLAMAMAANDGPDIFTGDIRQAVAQGLAHPLTEWIGEDGVWAGGQPKLRPDGSPDRNGQIDADEARWDGWMRLKPVYRQVCTVDGKPYALPRGRAMYVGILYSRRLLLAAGLDPLRPPRSHDEFLTWCRRLYNEEKGHPGVLFMPAAFIYAPWVASTGGSVVMQERRSPRSGRVYTFPEQAGDLRAPDTGEDLSGQPAVWRCSIAAPAARKVLDLYSRLRWEQWLRDPETGAPVALTPAQAAAGEVESAGRPLRFTPAQVRTGCIVPCGDTWGQMLGRLGRDYAMFPLWGNSLSTFENLGLDPTDMGMMPFPGQTPEQRPVLQGSVEYAMIGKDVVRRGGDSPAAQRAYRDFVWELLWRVSSDRAYDDSVRDQVVAGRARFVNPRDLQRLGFEDYIKECPPDYRQLWDDLDAGRILEVHEPFMGRWGLFGAYCQREILDIILRPSGEHFDYAAAAQRLEHDANSGLMFETPRATLDRHRPLARVVVAIVATVFVLVLALTLRAQLRRRSSRAGVYRGMIPWLMLLPALISIALWSYYPLFRGLGMAFQDFQIGGRAPFVGLDNFISIFLDPNFYHYLWTTGRFVLWSLALAFFTPILLALFLSEVPRLKVFFRTLFFLPQMTSGLVVMLMWKEMFIGTSGGTINRVLSFLFGWAGFTPVDWLGNPATVMACVIIPGVWAGAGAASLIYLAALKSVPDELYEAAGIDGAGILRKVWHITLPTIMPLVLINFVGAFIGTFQGMGSIFLLTFGGPGKETMVMGMAIWQEAYVNLRFSMATAYAWILGSILIGFTYLQLRLLRRVDFRQAKGD